MLGTGFALGAGLAGRLGATAAQAQTRVLVLVLAQAQAQAQPRTATSLGKIWVDPKQLLCPVLMVRGIHDGNSTDADLIDFFQQLPNGNRQYINLPNTAHSAGYSNNRHLLWYATQNFLAAPAAL